MNAIVPLIEGQDDGMQADVIAGLSKTPKQLSAKYFYDARGSQLFEQICAQPEYYLTRAELAIMEQHIDAMAHELGCEALLVEYGSGSGIKTRMLLEHMLQPVAYMPVEISMSALTASVERLHTQFPHIEMLPVRADFTQALDLPQPSRRQRRNIIYFPGSTLGNFDAEGALALLRHMRREMEDDGAALIGIDLVKDAKILEAAYNDAAGVTAKFTLNMLARFNRELDADFKLDNFAHQSRYNPMAERIETTINSRCAQVVHIAGQRIHFAAGESIHVELSCKYSFQSFARMAAKAGLRIAKVWTDTEQYFSVQYLVPAT